MTELANQQAETLLDIRGLSVEYLVGDARLRAVDKVSFTVNCKTERESC